MQNDRPTYHLTKVSPRWLALLISVCSFVVRPVMAEVTFPFDLPAGITATVDINTNKKRPFNNLLLGLNCNWPENQYGSVGYNHPDAQKLIRAMKPGYLRWPHGVWANVYDWEVDGRR
ncbi:MAG: hypothetical protein ABI318_06390, partial [Chthoniobacteraceae bacterium]